MDRKEAVKARLNEMPAKYRRTYLKAVNRKGMAAAIESFCLECCCDQREEIRLCSDLACPLWRYRPYGQTSEETLKYDVLRPRNGRAGPY